jgi:hypothetical protein
MPLLEFVVGFLGNYRKTKEHFLTCYRGTLCLFILAASFARGFLYLYLTTLYNLTTWSKKYRDSIEFISIIQCVLAVSISCLLSSVTFQ